MLDKSMQNRKIHWKWKNTASWRSLTLRLEYKCLEMTILFCHIDGLEQKYCIHYINCTSVYNVFAPSHRYVSQQELKANVN